MAISSILFFGAIPALCFDVYGVPGPRYFGAGSAMVNASVNPYNDLTWKDRILGFVAGSGLIIQGVARVHPVTTLPMGLLDYVVY